MILRIISCIFANNINLFICATGKRFFLSLRYKQNFCARRAWNKRTQVLSRVCLSVCRYMSTTARRVTLWQLPYLSLPYHKLVVFSCLHALAWAKTLMHPIASVRPSTRVSLGSRQPAWLHGELSMFKGMLGLLVAVVFGGRILRWVVFPTPCTVCMPFYLRVLVLFIGALGKPLRFQPSW